MRKGGIFVKITNKLRKKSVSKIVETLSKKQSATRNELIEGAIDLFGLTEEEKGDLSPKSKYSVIKSYLSTALNDLLNKKAIKRVGELYSLAKEELVIVREDSVELEILAFLEGAVRTMEDIYSHLESHFGTDTTVSPKDDFSLRSIAGNILFNLVDIGEIDVVSGKYTLKSEADNMAKCDTPLPENEFKPKFFRNLWLRGGAFFESFMAGLLEKYYSLSGQMVVYCDVSGGSDDGGIDVVLEVVDYFGFVEKIKVQTKNRDRAQINEKEVREFYGAMVAQGGTRGIYVTTTRFHEMAERFIESVDNLVGIDGDKLFNLVKRTQYGINKTKDGYTFDCEIFI